jgi:hypothetical protein
MAAIPEIILRKIYWYQWYFIQKTLCQEYHKRIVFINNYQNSLKLMDTLDQKKLYNVFNWRSRVYSDIWIDGINKPYEMSNLQYPTIKLPKRYLYTNGINESGNVTDSYGYKWISNSWSW